MLSFVCYKPDTCKYKPAYIIWIFPQEISVNLSIRYIGMLSDFSSQELILINLPASNKYGNRNLPMSNKYTGALICLCVTKYTGALICLCLTKCSGALICLCLTKYTGALICLCLTKYTEALICLCLINTLGH